MVAPPATGLHRLFQAIELPPDVNVVIDIHVLLNKANKTQLWSIVPKNKNLVTLANYRLDPRPVRAAAGQEPHEAALDRIENSRVK